MKKNYFKIFASALCLVGLFMTASCDITVKKIKPESNLAAISIGSSARTIGSSVSDIKDFTDLSLKYKISGSSDSETELKSWTAKDGVSAYEIASADIVFLPEGTYDFYLYGVKGNFTYRGEELDKDIVITSDYAVNQLAFEMKQFKFVAGSGNGGFSITLTVPDEVVYAMASLLNSSGAEISGYTAERINAVGNKIVYAKDSVPSGPYRANFVFYSETGVLLGYYREIVNIAAGDLSAGSREIASVNDLYTIEYTLNGGNFTGTAPEYYSRLSPVTTMPVVSKACFKFMGWYDNDAFDGEAIKSISSGNISLYAKFRIVATISANMRSWNASDKVAIYGKLTDDLEKAWTEISVAEIEDGTAYLDGLKGIENEYNAFMPASKKGNSVDYTGQVVASNGSTAHLDDYNYLAGYASSSSNGVLTMNALGSKVTLALQGVPAAKTYKKVVMYAPNYKFLTKGTVNFKTAALTATESDIHFEIALNNIKTTDGNLSVAAMIPPVSTGTYGSAGNKIVVTLIDTDNNYYCGTISNSESAGVSIEKGTMPSYTVAMEALPHYVIVDGVKVATHNVGAYSPYEEGNYYTYAEAKNALTNDPVFGSGYRLMEFADAAVLSSATMTQINTWVHGIKAGTDSNSVILSARGYYDSSLLNDNIDGNLWLSDTYDSSEAYAVYVTKDGIGITTWSRNQKFNVRPVKN